MIVGKMSALIEYVPFSCQKRIASFLKTVRPDMDEKKYEIDGENIYAKVMSYYGKEAEECAIEAHNKYVDIQFTLVGEEGIEIFDRSGLTTQVPYSEIDDVTFFCGSKTGYISVKNRPGMFAMFFPDEAHRPQISYDINKNYIKKGVIKIKEELFRKNNK